MTNRPMSNIGIRALLGVPKHANQHRLSRLTMEVHRGDARLFENVLMELLRHRAAMHHSNAEPVSNRDELRVKVRAEHSEWSQATFGDVGPVGPLKHLSKEALEAAAEPGDLSEWADMQFLLWDAQRRAGITDEQITQAMIDKLEVNKARQWPEPKEGEPRQHIKPAPEQEEKQCT